MGMRETALASMDLLLSELIAGLPDKEKELLHVQPRGGNTVVLVLADNALRLKQMADRCAQQREWLVKKATFPKLQGSQAWLGESQQRLDTLRDAMLKRIEPLCAKLVVGSPQVAIEMERRLLIEHDKTAKHLKLNLQAQHDEVVNDAGKRLWQVCKYIGTTAIGFLSALAVEHYKSPK